MHNIIGILLMLASISLLWYIQSRKTKKQKAELLAIIKGLLMECNHAPNEVHTYRYPNCLSCMYVRQAQVVIGDTSWPRVPKESNGITRKRR